MNKFRYSQRVQWTVTLHGGILNGVKQVRTGIYIGSKGEKALIMTPIGDKIWLNEKELKPYYG